MLDENFLEPGNNSQEAPSGGIWDDTGDQPYMMLQYDTDSPEFARGVQVGMIWQLLHGGVHEFEVPVYVSNTEMVIRMAEAAGYSFKAQYEEPEAVEGLEHEWMLITFRDEGSTDED